MERAPRNRTLEVNEAEREQLEKSLISLNAEATLSQIENRVINNDLLEVLDLLPSHFIDLLIIDPPYNIYKNYNGLVFKDREEEDYAKWMETWITKIKRCLKPAATIYVCCDWKTSSIIYQVLSKHFNVRNRITWEREKGRGAMKNWKNNIEDIYFATNSEDFTFNIDKVKLKKTVIAPYKNQDGVPKDWEDTDEGKFRLTHPSNVWTDISIPFWSMPENTDHPTQKSEKLIAKLILASSNEGDFVFDPFLGSGTTAVVAKKLNRKFSGVEINNEFCLWSSKRLLIADTDITIQGYSDGVFWERNSGPIQKKSLTTKSQTSLF